ncbi:MAG: RNA polymerase factor sigma-54 [Planctomycetota bacterium]|nr:RNA polymerase factor sigma-54 [Planctomycetota bacterium]
MKLELSQSLQQQQILAPQMILSMDILLLPTLDLEQRIREEFSENPALEIVEKESASEVATPETPQTPSGDSSSGDSSSSELFSKLEAFSDQRFYAPERTGRRASRSETDSKYEALQNTAGKPPGLKEFLTEQLHLRSLEQRIQEIGEEIINNLDHRGYLLAPVEELRSTVDSSREDFDQAIRTVRGLDPAGVAAEDLKECLLLQLARDEQEYPVEEEIIDKHLLDLGMNRIPKIARDLGKTVEEIKDAVEIISSLDPIPGGRLEPQRTIYIRPDVTVEIVNEALEVRIDSTNLPELQISESCRNILKKNRGNREVTDFVRKKIESAQWLIQAIQQRQRTLHDIAVALVSYQEDFMFHGPEKLRAMKMQTIADIVSVHISTISRAIKGKYLQTPYGLFEMRYFFTGGVDNEDGEIESRRNTYRRIEEIIENEDKARPHSDSEIARILQKQGLRIARRTVTKYREQKGIPSSRLRKAY